MNTPRGAVPFEGTLANLSQSLRVMNRLRRQFTTEQVLEVMGMLMREKLEGDLGEAAQDFLQDDMFNEAQVHWEGLVDAGHDHYPVHIKEYGGAFFVWAVDYEPHGFFLTFGAARDWVFRNWESVSEVRH